MNCINTPFCAGQPFAMAKTVLCGLIAIILLGFSAESLTPEVDKKFYAEEKLLVATSQDLYSIGLNNGTVTNQTIRSHSTYDIRAVAFDIRKNLIFSARDTGGYTRMSRNHLDSRTVGTIVLNLLNPGVGASYQLQVMAYDWITGNMYMVFENARRIHACNVTSRACVEILGNQVGRDVGGLVLHPNLGLMFWTQRDKDNRAIMTAKMDGSAPKTIRTEGVDHPAGITIDFENSLIFWLELSKGQIESTDLHGANYRKLDVTTKKYMLQHVVIHPGKGIYLAGNATGRSDGVGAGILLKQFQAEEKVVLSLPSAAVISGIAIHSFHSQPKTNGNRCENHSCTGLCLLSGDSYQCACPDEMILEPEEPLIIYSLGQGISVCSSGDNSEILAIESNEEVKSVSYMNSRQMLFWATDERIWEAYIGCGNTTKGSVSINTHVQISRRSLQYDWVGDNLYFITENSGLVGICGRLSSTCAVLDLKINTKLDSTIALNPMRGRMYWCANEGIQSSGMDGSDVLTLIKGPCQGPIAADADSLFFAYQGVLNSSDLDGNNVHTLVDLGGDPEVLVVAGPAVFWTLYTYPVAEVHSCDKISANNLQVRKVSVGGRILDIHGVHKSSQALRERNPCQGGGLCSHICALTSTGYMRCLCPEGLQLVADEFNCTAAGVTVPNDTAAVPLDQDRRRCPAGDQFRCLSTDNDVDCVNMSQVCDGIRDCPDVSDEGQRCNEPCYPDHECDHGCLSTPIGPMCACLFDEGWDDAGKKCIRFESDALSTKSLHMALSVLAVIAIALLFVAGIAVRKYRQAQEKMRNLTPEEIQVFLRGDPNAASTAADGVEKALSLPYECIITRESLDYVRDVVLGSGEFGVVYPGVWNKIEPVAVKTFKRTVGIDEFKAILAEVKIMVYLGQHSHIVKFLGADVSEIAQRKIIVVTELSPHGDLLRYLRKISVSKVPSGKLIHWCQQIADGMEFLTSKQIVHGDLAARNVLVFKDDVVKISDFGLSKQLYGGGQYIMKRQGKIPWKWASIELLTCSEFSEASDVWAFGVTAWEIFTLGQTPYKGMRPTEQFVQHLRQGNRLAQPDHASESIYKILLECWDLEKGCRPAFSTLNAFFQEQFASFKGHENEYFGSGVESSYVQAH